MKTYLSIFVGSGARQEKLEHLKGNSWKVRLRARAIEGEANTALCEKVATWLEIPRSMVTIVRGKKYRQKLLYIELLSPEEVERRLIRHLVQE